MTIKVIIIKMREFGKDWCIISESEDVLPIASSPPPVPLLLPDKEENEKRRGRVAAALKWERVEDMGAWTNGGHTTKDGRRLGRRNAKGRQSDPAES